MAGSEIVGYGACCHRTSEILLTAVEPQLSHLHQQAISNKVCTETCLAAAETGGLQVLGGLMERCDPAQSYGFVDCSIPCGVEAMLRAGFVARDNLAVLRKGPTVPQLSVPAFAAVPELATLVTHFQQLGAQSWKANGKAEQVAEVCGDELKGFVVYASAESQLVEGVGLWWPNGVLEACGCIRAVVQAALSAGLGQELRVAVSLTGQQQVLEWLLSVDFQMIQVTSILLVFQLIVLVAGGSSYGPSRCPSGIIAQELFALCQFHVIETTTQSCVQHHVIHIHKLMFGNRRNATRASAY